VVWAWVAAARITAKPNAIRDFFTADSLGFLVENFLVFCR
jgi:hypothetical protein